MAEEKDKTNEEAVKSLRDRLSELEDLELVNKLDIINLKNEIDSISLSNQLSPENARKITEIAKMADKYESLRKIDVLHTEIAKLRSDFDSTKGKEKD